MNSILNKLVQIKLGTSDKEVKAIAQREIDAICLRAIAKRKAWCKEWNTNLSKGFIVL